jgi:hypothetical protein
MREAVREMKRLMSDAALSAVSQRAAR